MKRVVVVEYDPAWVHTFEALRRGLESALADLEVRIEHVGSTAIPGLAAKPVIDLDIIVAAADVAHVIRALEDVGYRHRGNLGIDGREAFLAPPGSPKHHLYVCLEGCLALRNHLAVRDVLLADPDLAREYGALKHELAIEYSHDMEGYIAGKSEILGRILALGGISSLERDEIEQINGRPGGRSSGVGS